MTTIEKVIFTLDEARTYLAERGMSLGRNLMYELARSGKLRTKRFGKSYWVSKRELDRHLGIEA